MDIIDWCKMTQKQIDNLEIYKDNWILDYYLENHKDYYGKDKLFSKDSLKYDKDKYEWLSEIYDFKKDTWYHKIADEYQGNKRIFDYLASGEFLHTKS